ERGVGIPKGTQVMSRGNITRRGKSSWQLKFDVPGDKGKRQTRYVTVRGKRQDAQRELTRLLSQADTGSLVESSKATVAEHLSAWLGAPRPGEPIPPPPAGLTPKTTERYP